MATVVPLRGEQGSNETALVKPSETQFIYRALYDMWLAGEIRQSAFFFGTQLCARWQEYDVWKIAVLPNDASSTVVIDQEGRLIAGNPFEDFFGMIDAMQDLHFKCGILSHYVDSLLEEPDADKGHFTRDPMTSAHVDYGTKTPYFFKFDPTFMDELAARAHAARANLPNICYTKTLNVLYKK